MKYFRKIISLWEIIWISRHYFGHILVGLIYAWVLREMWGSFSWRFVGLALLGSVWIDVDHLLYWFTYGRHDEYAKKARRLLRGGQVRQVIAFAANNHKELTGLLTHNIYFIGFFLILSAACSLFDWESGVVLFGATVLHLLFDAFEDIFVLGYLNENWKRMPRRVRIIARIKSKIPLINKD